jgi:FkbM family methyltransferase
MAKFLNAVRRYYALLGLRGVGAWIYARIAGKQPMLAKNVDGIERPVYLRIGTTDLAVFRQVFIERHYEFSLSTSPRVIIDAGANIGLSAVFFANKYPDATIIAIEPAESNFQALVKNTLPYSQVKRVHAALWKENGRISLMDPGEGDHGFQTMKDDNTSARNLGLVTARTLDSLLSEMNLEHVDILKIDIEGSEKEVFEDCSRWIRKVEAIMVELHDDVKPGCGKAFAAATADFAQELSKGETLLRTRNGQPISP